mgnify:CR=1 FL=1
MVTGRARGGAEFSAGVSLDLERSLPATGTVVDDELLPVARCRFSVGREEPCDNER